MPEKALAIPQEEALRARGWGCVTGCPCLGSSSHISLVMTDDLGVCCKCNIDVGAKLAWVLVVLEALRGLLGHRKGLGKSWTPYQVPNSHRGIFSRALEILVN